MIFFVNFSNFLLQHPGTELKRENHGCPIPDMEETKINQEFNTEVMLVGVSSAKMCPAAFGLQRNAAVGFLFSQKYVKV